MQYTANFNLKKPGYDDIADIPGDFNDNMDIIDGKLKEIEDEMKTVQTQTIGPTTDNIITLNNSVKGQVSDVTLSGRTLINLVGEGNIESNLTSDDTSSAITMQENGTIAFGGYSTAKKFSFLNGRKYFIVWKFNSGNVHSMELRTSDGTFIKGLSDTTRTNILKTIFEPTQDYIDHVIKISEGDTGTITNGYFMVYDITGDSETDLDVLSQKYNYVIGTKSTVMAQMIKSQNKNLFDGRYDVGSIDGITFQLASGTVTRRTKPILCKKNQPYTISGGNRSVWRFEDRSGNLIQGATGTAAISPPTAEVMRVYYSSDGTHENIMINEGNVALPYEPHESDKSYILCTDENGNIMTANALYDSNGNVIANDEFSDGKLYKRTEKTIFDGTENWSQYTIETLTDYSVFQLNISDIATNPSLICDKFKRVPEIYLDTKIEEGISGHGSLQRVYIKILNSRLSTIDVAGFKTWLSNNPTSLIYQLAEEKVYEIAGFNSVQSFDGITHVIFEPVIRFEEIADQNGQITIPYTNYPINFIEKVEEKIISKDSISYIDASYSQVDNQTVGGLIYGKKYRVVYHYPEELTTGPTIEATYPINTAATIAGLLDVQRRLQEELGSVWVTLLPLADKELRMYALSTIPDTSTATTQELGDKINELINVWK